MSSVIAIGPDITNGAKAVLDTCVPYGVFVRIVGSADLLFHRWNVEGVEAKAKAAKGSKAKKSDDLETYVYRDDDNNLCLPGEYLRQSVINAAKYRQDPRSPRKSAMDLYKAGIVSLTPLASLGTKSWDYEHRCRVTVQRNGITRVRPAFKAGWSADVNFMINLPEYIQPDAFHEVLVNAGRLVGLADSRPTYGRFQVSRFELMGL
jgi:hypothetical protein